MNPQFTTLKDLKKNEPIGILSIEAVSATGIPPMDANGLADPYVILNFGQKTMKSPMVKTTLEPVWNHQFRFLIFPEQAAHDIFIELWDWDRFSKDDFIGKCDPLSIDKYTKDGNNKENISLDFKLDKQPKKQLSLPSKINLNIKFVSKSDLIHEFWQGLVEYFDTDGDGTIDSTEFTNLLVGVHSDSEVLEEYGEDFVFKAIDKDGDGNITAEELAYFMEEGSDLAQKLWKNHTKVMWQVLLAVHDEVSIGEMIMDKWRIAPRKSVQKDNSKLKNEILVHVRETGKLEVELIPNYIRVAMKMMYSNSVGRATTNKISKILNSMTMKQGKTYDNPKSKKEIESFIQFHKLNIDEMRDDVTSFKNFNEFFYRKLKDDARIIKEIDNNAIAVSPADCRLNVFPTLDEAKEIWIKGTSFTLSSLLQDETLAKEFEQSSLVIARLAPQDYHRFHSPVSGTIGDFKLINGTYFTVNPIAINQKIDVYGKNKRLVTTIETKDFGKVVFVAVGATMVGSINMTVEPKQTIKKGDELGYFAFGGSTCLVLFKQGTIAFDNDLMVNSAKPIETLIKVGDSIGQAIPQ